MKKIKLSLACISVSLLLFSCGNKSNETSTNEPAVQNPQAFYDNVESHTGKCDDSYYTFNEALYADAEDKVDVQAAYDAMVKTFATEKEQLSTVDIATGGEDQTLSKNLKDLATKHIDTYIEVGKKEFLDLKNLSLEGKTDSDEDFLNAENAADEKLGEISTQLRKAKKEFREKYNLAKK